LKRRHVGLIRFVVGLRIDDPNADLVADRQFGRSPSRVFAGVVGSEAADVEKEFIGATPRPGQADAQHGVRGGRCYAKTLAVHGDFQGQHAIPPLNDCATQPGSP
jgi:hypothetical protein